MLNIVTGNLDRPGGSVFGWAPVALDTLGERFGMATYGTRRSPFGDFPEVMGTIPTTELARAMEDSGSRRLRCLFVSAGNPVLSAPQGQRIARAMSNLDLSVAVDCYLSETAMRCDYVLPAATFLERDDVPFAFLGTQLTPFLQMAEAVLPPAGEAREEWEVYDELARRLGLGAASGSQAVRWLGRRGIHVQPTTMVGLLLRTSRAGDWFGLRRRGLSLNRLREHPHGVVLKEELPTGVLRKKVRHRDRRVHLHHDAIRGEVERLLAREPDLEYPLRLIGMRESRSLNSWLHNARRLAAHAQPRHALVHPQIGEQLGLVDGCTAVIESRSGHVEVLVRLTDEVEPETIAYPHGWGHAGGWALANGLGGAQINELSSDDPADVEPLAGMSRLNGVPVRLVVSAAPDRA